jgi:hypothetical protein
MSNATAAYFDLQGTINRCEASLAAMDADDYLRPNVEALLLLAKEEMEKVLKEIPF